MGDSAGGNLAAVITQRRKLRGDSQFAGQVLMYPLMQMADLQSVSYRYFQKNLEGYALVGGFLFDNKFRILFGIITPIFLTILHHTSWNG